MPLQDTRSIMNVLGALLKKPDLLIESKIELEPNDFPVYFHKLTFGAIKKLYNTGTRNIDPSDVDTFLSNYKKQYKIFEKNNGLEYLYNAQDLCNIELFDYHVERIKKFSLLRNLQEKKFYIKNIYDESNEKIMQEFDEMSLADIISYYDKNLIEIQSCFMGVEEGSHIAEGADELIQELEQSPEMGYDCGINALNYFIYGLRKKYYLLTANSGAGKSRGQAYFSLYLGYYLQIENLFISTEMKRDEIQTMMIAHLANVNERKILTGDTTDKEKKRIRKATKEFKKAKIHIVYMPDFTLEKIEYLMKKYIILKKVKFIFFDYIKEAISMLENINKKIGQIEGWKALNLFSERLKMLVEKYNIGIMSATQVGTEGNTAGSKAIPNSVDVWLKLRDLTDDEFEQFGFTNITDGMRLMAIDGVKNRRGEKDFLIILETDLGRLLYKEQIVVQNGQTVTIPKIKFEND